MSIFPFTVIALLMCNALLGMEKFDEAFYVLARINLAKLDEFWFREFSEASLDLAGKMIIAKSKICENIGHSFSVCKFEMIVEITRLIYDLANSLKDQGLYNEAISEYARLGPIVKSLLDSPYKTILELWPIYCYIKLYESYMQFAARDKRYATAANKMFNTALQTIKKIDENPPPRQSNEYSLYKLIRSLIRVQYARQYEAASDNR